MPQSLSVPPGAQPYSAELVARLHTAFETRGPDYVPRTHHVIDGGRPKFVNRLILETSPYLLQHAHNPVGWYPWGSEAFAAAESLGRPILLSVGYSTCHWCHVMEVESFEDLEIATYINEHFIPVKVDREERPDVDDVYMSAVQLMSGDGGWPMTVVTTADGRPFFGGTYFPPRDGARGARLGFLTILKRLVEVWEREPEKVTASADEVKRVLVESAQRLMPQGAPGPSALAEAARSFTAQFDPQFGGFGVAPKFPRPAAFDLLLRYHRRTGDDAALHVVTHSLARMIDGGIHDQLGGGFHRYATDRQWLVPHFEKMLYDNAQLVSTLLETHQASGDPTFADAARTTLEYVMREMTSPTGAFFSATDADSEGEEGRFFVWERAELDRLLGSERAAIAAAHWGVTIEGNFEDGKNVLHRPASQEHTAKVLGIDVATLEREIRAARALLYEARKKRVPPLLDDKILTEWNAQMISAFAQASLVLDEPRHRLAAVRAAEHVLEALHANGRLFRAWRLGEARHPGVLEDYAFFMLALLDLFEVTSDLRWLEHAITLEATLEAQFYDPADGAYFGTPRDGEALLVRAKPVHDGAQPSGNSAAVLALLRLAELTGEPRYRARAEGVLRAFGALLERSAVECPKLATGLDWALDRPKSIVVVTTDADDGRALLTTLAALHVPNRVLVVAREDQLPALAVRVPFVAGKNVIDGRATAYVCTEGVCEAPTSDPATFARELEERSPFPLQKKLRLPR
ncbi:thioredoxin domain-containing protein [Myxococcota bacterium]|nr:thioredoxin domain-containing protein [Myxococcota bacterium]